MRLVIKNDCEVIAMKSKKKSIYWGEISFYKSIIAAIIFSAVVLVVDQKNIPSLFIDKYGIKETVIGVIFGTIILSLCFGRIHISDLLKMPCGNVGDGAFISGVISCISIGVCDVMLGLIVCYKLIVLVVILTLLIVIVILRYCFCRTRQFKAQKVTNSTVDLGQLVSGEISELKLPIIFTEEASEYDLLGREGLVNVVYNSIRGCNPEHVYVIGLKGAWGSGKTTILNIVKRKIQENSNDIIVIDDFDPWIFGSQEALLCAMYDAILSKTGIYYSTYSSKQTVKKLKETVTNRNEVSSVLGMLMEVNQRDYETVKEIKQRIGVYLKQLEQPVVFMIDNLDRAESDNILFLFKLIGSVFDLPNIIYVLAYDDARIQSVFSDENKVNPKYIEKIVKQEIVIPEISKDTMESVCSSSIERTLLAYGVQSKDIAQYKDVSHFICSNMVDLRQFKRLLNSVFVSTFLYDNELYKPHLLAIEVIRFLGPDLYEEIKRNKKFFVSKDLYYSGDGLYLSTVNKKQFNADGKSYFKDLFCKYAAYEDILANMFPYVKRYKSGSDLLSDYAYADDSPEHNSIASIASAKYFDLYFSYGTNDFLVILSNVDNFINRVNLCNNEKIEEITEQAIEKVGKGAQTEWFERLQNKIEEIDSVARPCVAAGICNSIKKVDTTRGFFMLSADQRALVVATKLLKGSDYTAIESLIEKCSKNYNIRLLEEIMSNCSAFKKRGDSDYGELLKIAEAKYYELCNEILDEKVDIYSDDNFQRGKIWALYRSIPEGDRSLIHNYMKSIVNENNIFRILSDMISESTGTRGYGYSINADDIETLFGGKETLKDVISKVVPQNETEKFILSLWERMESGVKNSMGEKNYYSPVPVNIIP